MKTRFWAILVILAINTSLFATTFQVNNIWYYVTHASEPYTVAVTYNSTQTYTSTSITIPSSVSYLGVTYQVTSIGRQAFQSCSNLRYVTMPTSITSIDYRAFATCTSLQNIKINSAVTTIDPTAFEGCSSISYIWWNAKRCGNFTSCPFSSVANTLALFSFGDSVEHIPAYLCNGLTQLTTLTIPSGVQSMGNYAIKGCKRLTTVTCKATVPPTTGSQTAFESALTKLFVPCGTVDDYKKITGWKSISTIQGSMFSDYHVTVQSNNTQFGTANVSVLCDNTIEATPSIGYRFLEWNDGNTENPRVVNLVSDVTFTAKFVIDTLNVSLNVNDSEMGSVTGAGAYIYNKTAQIRAIANTGYQFVKWNDENTDNPRNIIVTQDTSFVAQFVKTSTVTLQVNDNTMGSVTGAGTYVNNTVVQISAKNKTHYHFTHWNDGITTNPRNIYLVSDTSLTAEFEIDSFTLTLTTNDENMGTVTGGGTYAYGTIVPIEAIANDGYEFMEWADNITSNQRNINLISDTTLTAKFKVVTAIQQTTVIDGVYAHNTKIIVNNSENLPVIIYDIFGRLITQGSCTKQEFSVPSTGLYLVKVGQKTMKLMVP